MKSRSELLQLADAIYMAMNSRDQAQIDEALEGLRRLWRDGWYTSANYFCNSLVSFCVEPFYSSREFGTPGRLLGLRCRICGSECPNGGFLEHDYECGVGKLLAARDKGPE